MRMCVQVLLGVPSIMMNERTLTNAWGLGYPAPNTNLGTMIST